MTNLEQHPTETVARSGAPVGTAWGEPGAVGGAGAAGRGGVGTEPTRIGVQVLTPRDVPLGGLRAMTVRRTLPQRDRSFIGAWCFLDHYGPDDVSVTGGMAVPPHPHTGLQTVSWLFSGEIEHRDSLGTHSMVRPGELNLMTAGHGISHSEDSTPATTILHGVQLWTALPEQFRDVPPAFQHYAPVPILVHGGTVRVFLGSLAGSTSPVPTFSRLVGAEVLIEAGASVTVDVDEGFEHGVLVDAGDVVVTADGEPAGTSGTAGAAEGSGSQAEPGGTDAEAWPEPGGIEATSAHGSPSELLFLARGATRLTLTASTTAARVLLIGGESLGEQIVMWWNFIGRSHDDVVEARRAWQAEIGAEPDRDAAPPGATPRFGTTVGHPHPPLPAPVIPPLRLRPRE